MDKLIEFFINEPERMFHIRELSKKLKKSPTTISKYLKHYEKENLLKSERSLNHLFFKADTESRKFKQQKLFYNIFHLYNSGLINFLENEFNHPGAIILFGSYMRGENIQRSDIDILIISNIKKELNVEKFENKLNHNIQLFIYSNKEIEKMKQTNKELLNNFINGMVLEGYWELYK